MDEKYGPFPRENGSNVRLRKAEKRSQHPKNILHLLVNNMRQCGTDPAAVMQVFSGCA